MPKKIAWTPEQIERICGQLLGSCGNLDTKLEEEFGGCIEDMPDEMLSAIDDRIALCSVCDWWVETHEVDATGACSDCR